MEERENMKEKGGEFYKVVDKLAESIKVPGQIIDRRVLQTLIEETEELFDNICANPYKFEVWHKKVVSNNLRALRLINQRLGYE